MGHFYVTFVWNLLYQEIYNLADELLQSFFFMRFEKVVFQFKLSFNCTVSHAND